MTVWTGRRVLVTGAGGFIGSHVAERFVTLGATVRAFVRYTGSGSWGWLDESPLRGDMEVVAGDVTDAEGVRQAMRGSEVVCHLAALIAIPYSYRAALSYLRTNVEGTLNVLQAARELDGVRVVHTSTSEVYGTARYVPIDEAHPVHGQSPYSATKIGADKLAEAYHLSHGLPVVIVRPFNTFGPRQSARAIIPTIITQALTQPTVKLGNLHPTRDLTFVTDTADGFALAAASQDAVGRTVNLGTGTEVSVEQLARTIAGMLGTTLSIEQDTDRVRPAGGEVDRLLSDNTLARQLLGWKPGVTLEEGLQRTIAWVRAHLGRYRPGAYAI